MGKMIRLPYYLGLMSILVSGLWACEKEDPQTIYERKMEAALETDERQDDLFLGIHFGMERQAFYDHCWQLNREGVFREGMGNASVSYVIEEDVKEPVNMEFYPDFSDAGTIFAMDVELSYVAWAPWNKPLYAEKLIPEAVHLLEDWYDTDFIRLDDPRRGAVFVAIDANRRISMYILNEHRIRVRMLDLTVSPDEPLVLN